MDQQKGWAAKWSQPGSELDPLAEGEARETEGLCIVTIVTLGSDNTLGQTQVYCEDLLGTPGGVLLSVMSYTPASWRPSSRSMGMYETFSRNGPCSSSLLLMQLLMVVVLSSLVPVTEATPKLSCECRQAEEVPLSLVGLWNPWSSWWVQAG